MRNNFRDPADPDKKISGYVLHKKVEQCARVILVHLIERVREGASVRSVVEVLEDLIVEDINASRSPSAENDFQGQCATT
jgi:hypothetical protein